MAADVGSMFQYWKKFDLRRLQVSILLYLSVVCDNANSIVHNPVQKYVFGDFLGL